MGQALLPEHFYTQEQSIREEVYLRLRMQPAPSWGIGSLRWDDFQLVKGLLSIEEMTLVLPTGTLIDIPGNTAPVVFNLNATGAVRVQVYAHLESGYEVISLGQSEDGDEGIQRIAQKIELTIDPYSETAAQSFKLAALDCAPDGTWSLRSDYIPPLIQVGDSPFFKASIERINALVRAIKQVLLDEIQKNHLAGDTQSAAKDALRGLFNFEAMLTDCQNGIRLHPYDLFRGLRSLYIDFCVFRDTPPAETARPYTHEDIAGCFGALLGQLEQLASLGGHGLPYTEFARKDGMFICELGKEVKRAKDVFWLVQKQHVSTKLDLSRMKLAAPSRIQVVYERALRGIPFERIETPTFSHGLSSTIDFYALSPGQEWDSAVAEGKVVLFDNPLFEGSRLYLYWRTE